MKSRKEVMAVIAQASGTMGYHRFSENESYPVITDGVLALAEATGCFWLLDIVGSCQSDKRLDPNFQVWKLAVDLEKQSAVLTGCNDTELIVKRGIAWTDFPLEEVRLWVMDGVVLLPGEH